jgi:hypothetical protein
LSLETNEFAHIRVSEWKTPVREASRENSSRRNENNGNKTAKNEKKYHDKDI